jgi:hypothetical protein
LSNSRCFAVNSIYGACDALWCHFSATTTVTAKGGSVIVVPFQAWATGRVTLAATSTVVTLP